LDDIAAVCVQFFVYADDIILVAPSVDSLQALLTLVEILMTLHQNHYDIALVLGIMLIV